MPNNNQPSNYYQRKPQNDSQPIQNPSSELSQVPDNQINGQSYQGQNFEYQNNNQAVAENYYDSNNQYFDYGQEPLKEEKPKVNISQKLKKFSDFLAAKWLLIIIGLVVIFGLIGGAYYVTSLNQEEDQPIAQNYNNVTASIIAQNTLPQLSPGEWEVLIQNNESVAIRDVVVTLDFDTDFEYIREISYSPENPEGNVYRISRLDPLGGRSSSVRIRFEGNLIGRPDIETIMTGSISYQAENPDGTLSQVYQGLIPEARTKITSPRVAVTLIPTVDEVQNGGEAEFTIKINNQTDQDIRDLRVRMIYPAGQDSFTYTSSEYTVSNTVAPKTNPDDGDDIWLISRLSGGAEHTLKVRGKVFGSNEARLNFGVEIGAKTSSNDYPTIVSNYKDILVLAQPILLDVQIAGKTADSTFQPGESLTFNIEYTNQSQKTYNNLEIISFVDDEANILDLSTINFVAGERGDIAGSQIAWNPVRVSQLETVRPSQSGELSFTVEVKELDSFINTNLDQTDYTLRPGVQVKADNLELITHTGSTYKGRGNLELFVDEPEFVKENPLTNSEEYKITWRVRGWQNQVQDVELNALLPIQSEQWLDKIEPASEASSLNYNPNNGEIKWTLGTVPSYTGISKPEVAISFFIEVPKSGDKDVAKDIILTGKDVFTGENYQVENEDLEI